MNKMDIERFVILVSEALKDIQQKIKELTDRIDLIENKIIEEE